MNNDKNIKTETPSSYFAYEHDSFLFGYNLHLVASYTLRKKQPLGSPYGEKTASRSSLLEKWDHKSAFILQQISSLRRRVARSHPLFDIWVRGKSVDFKRNPVFNVHNWLASPSLTMF